MNIGMDYIGVDGSELVEGEGHNSSQLSFLLEGEVLQVGMFKNFWITIDDVKCHFSVLQVFFPE
jgi:hypothetical protein